MSSEPEEFANRCNEYRRTLLCYAYACCRDLVLAEEIVQEALVIAHNKREHYFPEADFKGWLISLVRNVWFRERDRKQIKERQTRFIEENATILFDAQETQAAPQVQYRVLAKCLEKLDEKDRSIIHDHFGSNLKYSEIAERMQQNLSWVKMRMLRARMALLECVKFNLQKETLLHET